MVKMISLEKIIFNLFDYIEVLLVNVVSSDLFVSFIIFEFVRCFEQLECHHCIKNIKKK